MLPIVHTIAASVTSVPSTAREAPKLPSWVGPIPSFDINASGGLPMTPGVAHFTIYNATTAGGAPNAHGTYNHGPMITSFNGTFLTSWYNSPKDESSQMRSVFAYSADGQAWSEPLVAFPNFTANGVENGPWTTLNGRLYTQSGSEDAGLHKETIVSIMRRVSVPSSATAPPTLGPPFWLNATVPAAFVGLGFRTYLQMDDETRADAEQYLPGSFRTRAPLLPAAFFSFPRISPEEGHLAEHLPQWQVPRKRRAHAHPRARRGRQQDDLQRALPLQAAVGPGSASAALQPHPYRPAAEVPLRLDVRVAAAAIARRRGRIA